MKNAIQTRLSVGLSIVTITLSLIAGFVAFFVALHEAHQLQDDNLMQVAQHLSHGDSAAFKHDVAMPVADPESELYVQKLNGSDKTSIGVLPMTLQNGIQTISVASGELRVAVAADGRGHRVAVAQSVELRDEFARNSAWQTIFPLLLMVPIQILLVAALTQRALKPVNDLARELKTREPHALRALPDQDVPRELAPFVDEINRLLERVEASVQNQQKFVANAAHELRSPLTAISLQMERLQQVALSAEAQSRLSTLLHGVKRQRQLLDQLLSLARAQVGESLPASQTHVLAVVTQVLEDVEQQAFASGVELGVSQLEDAVLQLGHLDAYTMLRNLVDNAIRYAPQRGRVEISAQRMNSQVVLSVTDNGPGINPEELEKVREPFYRIHGSEVEGSGLGLSIVDTLAKKCGGKLVLGASDSDLPGFTVQIWLPTCPPDEVRSP